MNALIQHREVRGADEACANRTGIDAGRASDARQPAWRIACELAEARGVERAVAERFIAQCYWRNFQAHVDAFMPRLFVLRNETCAIRGAFGLRAAASGRLFVERYLDEPVEHAIERVCGVVVPREAIVEVGHFAGLLPGTMRLMIVLLAERLTHEGKTWVVFAGTRAMRNAFLRMHLAPTPVADASPERLTLAERARWGSYYRHQPRVYVGPVAAAPRTNRFHCGVFR